MKRSCSFLLLAVLCGCAATAPARLAPSHPSPSARQSDGDRLAPEVTVMPLGVGLTSDPKTTLFRAAIDFPLDRQLTFGPAFGYGFDDDVDIATGVGQLKYYLPPWGREGGFTVRPYVTAGVGVAYVDAEGRGADAGLVVNGGLGLRYLTGEHYRLGSEVRLNYLPDDLGGEDTFFAFEVLHVVISF